MTEASPNTDKLDDAMTVVDAYRNVTETVGSLLSGGSDAVGKAFFWTGYAVSFTANYTADIANGMAKADAIIDANFRAALTGLGSVAGAVAGGAMAGGAAGVDVGEIGVRVHLFIN
jgi:hypothetical protein